VIWEGLPSRFVDKIEALLKEELAKIRESDLKRWKNEDR
jgi:hypothetical protein